MVSGKENIVRQQGNKDTRLARTFWGERKAAKVMGSLLMNRTSGEVLSWHRLLCVRAPRMPKARMAVVAKTIYEGLPKKELMVAQICF